MKQNEWLNKQNNNENKGSCDSEYRQGEIIEMH